MNQQNATILNNSFEEHAAQETSLLFKIKMLENGTINASVAEFDAIIDHFHWKYIQSHSFVPIWIKAFLVVFGIVTNSINIAVFTRPCMPPSSINTLIVGLESVNLIVYATFFNEIGRHYSRLYNVSYLVPMVGIVTICVEESVVSVSNWITVAIGIWRLLVISNPLRAGQRCSKFRAKLTLLLIGLCSAPLGILKAFLYTHKSRAIIIRESNQVVRTEYVHRLGKSSFIAENPTLLPVSNGLTLLTTVVPCSVLAVVTLALLFYLWKARNERKAMRRVNSDKYDLLLRHLYVLLRMIELQYGPIFSYTETPHTLEPPPIKFKFKF